MIRFIDLSGQLEDGVEDFAWFNTRIDKFITMNGNQTWSCWKDFEMDHSFINMDGYRLDCFKDVYPRGDIDGI